jgi:catalase (peroxidase I)
MRGSIYVPPSVSMCHRPPAVEPFLMPVQIKSALQGTAAEGLSFADIIAETGALAPSMRGGPGITLLVGRSDTKTPDPENRFPFPSHGFATLLTIFTRQGLTLRDLVALSGSHSIGRLPGGDAGTPAFDNNYYVRLLDGTLPNDAQGLVSDRSLLNNATARQIVEQYAKDQKAFLADYAAAYIKIMQNGHTVCA